MRSIEARLLHLEQMIDSIHRGDVTVHFDNGDMAQMPLGDAIPLLRQDRGISRVTDAGTGNGILCDLINDLLEGEND